MNIVLCGLPKSGKTTIGKILAEKLATNFTDIDDLIETEYKKREGSSASCREIFKKRGEEYFRQLEKAVVASLNTESIGVISLGGGTLECESNLEKIKSVGTLVYLKRDVNDIFRNLTQNVLPAYLDPKNIRGSFDILANRRSELFEKSAEIHCETDNQTLEEIVEQILLRLPKKIEVNITHQPIQYPIVIQEGILESKSLLKYLKNSQASLYFIITDENIEHIHAKKLENFLKNAGLNTFLYAIPTGEEFKNRTIKEACENCLLELNGDRDTCIIGIGGGVVTDLAGFVASTYLRGVSVILIPTSLLGMVDAAIGGKSGVNVSQGKNLIGSVWQPDAVIIDPLTLTTLPEPEIKNGFSEMIKHGLIADKDYFYFLKNNAKNILQLNVMKKAISDSIIIKSRIIEQDQREHGCRRLLNYGHTFAHAIESVTQYQIPHGKAVAIGILAASHLSVQLGYMPKSDFHEIMDIFDSFEMDLDCNVSILPSQLYEKMKIDKKSHNNNPRFVLIERIGKPIEFSGKFCTQVDENLLKNTLEWICTDVMHCH